MAITMIITIMIFSKYNRFKQNKTAPSGATKQKEITMNFLPQDYKAPKTGGHYMKFQDGENKFRIMSAPILGWEDWIDNRPVRYKLEDKPTKSHDASKPIKHFWSFIVFNYASEQIEILHITQASIRSSLEALSRDADWGAPYTYDIKVTKKGQGKDTEYTVNPCPHRPVDQYIVTCFSERKCYLEALFDNADPFALGWPHYTTLGIAGKFENDSEFPISMEDLRDIQIMFANCPTDYQDQIMKSLGKMIPPIKKIAELPPGIFHKFKDAIQSKYQEEQNKTAELFDLITG